MTELDAYNALMLAIELAQNTGQMLLTILTGYLLITFFMGDKLTTFQVCFVNVVFLLAYGSTWQTLFENLESAEYFRGILVSLKSQMPAASTSVSGTPTFNIVVGSLLTIGALYFMWSVRHPKAE
jgi:hypothetical protein